MSQVKYCTNENCLAENNITNKFCSKCGTPFVLNNPQNELPQEPQITNQSPQNILSTLKSKKSEALNAVKHKLPFVKKHKKKMIIFGVLLVSIAIILIGLSFFINNERTLTKALDTANSTEKLLDVTEIEHASKFEITAYNKLIEEEEGVENIADGLKANLEYLASIKDMQQISYTTSNQSIKYIIKKNKILGVIPHYVIEPQRVLATATTSYGNMKLDFAGKFYALEQDHSIKLTKYLPGIYDYQFNWDTPYGNAQQKASVYLSESGINDVIVAPDMYSVVVDNYDYDELTYFANDKELETNVYVLADTILVPEGTSFKLKAEMTVDGETYESQIVKINGEDHVEFEFEGLDEASSNDSSNVQAYTENEEELEGKVQILLNDYYNAYTSGDASNLDGIIAEDSHFLSAQKKQMNHLKEKGITVEMASVEYDSIEQVDEDNITAVIDEVYNVTYANGEYEDLTQHSTYKLKKYDDQYYIVDFSFN